MVRAEFAPKQQLALLSGLISHEIIVMQTRLRLLAQRSTSTQPANSFTQFSVNRTNNSGKLL